MEERRERRAEEQKGRRTEMQKDRDQRTGERR